MDKKELHPDTVPGAYLHPDFDMFSHTINPQATDPVLKPVAPHAAEVMMPRSGYATGGTVSMEEWAKHYSDVLKAVAPSIVADWRRNGRGGPVADTDTKIVGELTAFFDTPLGQAWTPEGDLKLYRDSDRFFITNADLDPAEEDVTWQRIRLNAQEVTSPSSTVRIHSAQSFRSRMMMTAQKFKTGTKLAALYLLMAPCWVLALVGDIANRVYDWAYDQLPPKE